MSRSRRLRTRRTPPRLRTGRPKRAGGRRGPARRATTPTGTTATRSSRSSRRPGGPPSRVGCGEGRVTRDLTHRGHRVIAIDIAPALLRLARDSDERSAYLVADGAALPFG